MRKVVQLGLHGSTTSRYSLNLMKLNVIVLSIPVGELMDIELHQGEESLSCLVANLILNLNQIMADWRGGRGGELKGL